MCFDGAGSGFLTAGTVVGFLVAVAAVMGFFACTAVGFLYGTVLVWAGMDFFAGPTALGPVVLGPAMGFFVPMGWETISVDFNMVIDVFLKS